MAVKDYKQVSAIVVDADTVRIGGSAFVRERTCRLNQRCCSECGVYIHTDAVLAWKDVGGSGMVVTIPVKYCPSCGRRVVD